MVKVSNPFLYRFEDDGVEKETEEVDVTFQMMKAHFDYINKIVKEKPWWRDLDEFIIAAIRDYQEKFGGENKNV